MLHSYDYYAKRINYSMKNKFKKNNKSFLLLIKNKNSWMRLPRILMGN